MDKKKEAHFRNLHKENSSEIPMLLSIAHNQSNWTKYVLAYWVGIIAPD